jgi:hypothetical protein
VAGQYVHLFLNEGRTVDVSVPRNSFPLRPAPGVPVHRGWDRHPAELALAMAVGVAPDAALD